MDEEITITISSANSSESLSISCNLSTNELKEFACALLSLSTDQQYVLIKDGRSITISSLVTLKTAGIKNGDLVFITLDVNQRPQQQQQQAATAAAPSLGGLDFSNLLGGQNTVTTTTTTTNQVAAASNSSSLSFNIAGLELAAAKFSSQVSSVEWNGMTLDDAISNNPNPVYLIPLLFNTEKHPNLLKELNYHNPQLVKKIKDAYSPNNNIKAAAKVWSDETMKGSITRAFQTNENSIKEVEMTNRLKQNPTDAEANQYFGEKIRKENVQTQYRQMMEEYPESLGRVLMLYISAEVNSHSIQAFVDSGAQSTIMSAACAERCGLLHLLDERFEGTAVGVGTGKILGRIHLCPLKINNHFFPCTITVMENQNMEFLFGLDMLKRHKCVLDLARSVLVFSEVGMEAPFLHEHDLDESKGGTKGFDADKANMELEKMDEHGDKKE